MADKSIGDRIIGWYGNVAASNLGRHPDFVRRWLMAGFGLMTQKSKALPDGRFLPSGRRGYALFMGSVVGAMADPDHSVVTSIFMPTELFRAMGLKPMTAEAVASFASGAQAEGAFIAQAEGAGFPETYCSYHRALLGMATSGALRPRRLVASTSVACDANNLTFRELERRWGCKRSYIDVPYDTGDDSIRYVADQLREAARLAEDTFGRRLDRERLRQMVSRSLATQRAMLDGLSARRGRYLANTMTLDMMEMLDFQLSLGTPEALELARQMVRDFGSGREFCGINLVWAHIAPYFLGSIGSVIDCSPTAQIVASDMMFHNLMDPDGLLYGSDQPFEAMAERVVKSCFNGPAERRIRALRQLADVTHADGAVVFCHWGCKQTAGAAQLIRHALEDVGYPVLVLDGDGCDRANCMEGQMSTRFNAFMEMVQARKSASDGGTWAAWGQK